MKKFIVTFLLILISSQTTVFGQKSKTLYYQKALKERVFVHYNTSFALTGEHLLYKVYCIRDRNNQLSGLSKVAYVELIDAKEQVVFKNKLRLNNGTGNGSFFIPNTIPSGNYKLIAYTEWMRNEGEHYFFKGDVTIINTSQNNQNLQVKSGVETKIKVANSSTGLKTKPVKKEKDNFKLVLSQQVYAKRQKIQLKLEGLDNNAILGSYSVSARKVNTFKKAINPTSKTYTSIYPKNNVDQESVAHFLPEFKGDVLKGSVLHKETGAPISNVKIVLSVPNKKFRFRFAITDENGIFEFVFKTVHQDPKAVIQILDAKKEMYKLVLAVQKPLTYKGLTFNEIEMSPKVKEELLAYSIQNQIENAYGAAKQNTSVNKFATENQFNKSVTYLLNDYNRFASVKETVIEIVKNVRIIKKNNTHTFFVRNSDGFDEIKERPLVIVDGVFIQNHDEIIDFNASKIKSISIVREKYVYDSYIFQGIIFIETFTKDYKNSEISNYIKNIQFDVSLNKREFYTQPYRDGTFDRVPDYRRQLAWLPELDLYSTKKTIDFYTSDVVGDFEITLEGFTKEGKPISLKEFFSVK
jgi:hypothetical protein